MNNLHERYVGSRILFDIENKDGGDFFGFKDNGDVDIQYRWDWKVENLITLRRGRMAYAPSYGWDIDLILKQGVEVSTRAFLSYAGRYFVDNAVPLAGGVQGKLDGLDFQLTVPVQNNRDETVLALQEISTSLQLGQENS